MFVGLCDDEDGGVAPVNVQLQLVGEFKLASVKLMHVPAHITESLIVKAAMGLMRGRGGEVAVAVADIRLTTKQLTIKVKRVTIALYIVNCTLLTFHLRIALIYLINWTQKYSPIK